MSATLINVLKAALLTANNAVETLQQQQHGRDPVIKVKEESSLPALEDLARRFMHEAEAEENPVVRRSAFDEAACMVRKAIRDIESKTMNWLVVWQVVPESVALYSINFSVMSTESRLATMDMLEMCAGHYIGEVGLPSNVDLALEKLSEFLQELTPIWDSNNGDHYGTFCTLEHSVAKVIVTGQIL